ncbi:hypothetical protein CB1_000568024 [Camelus ferus]|nr:hypothetical protein CB1_000568024 [Camelus ferus]
MDSPWSKEEQENGRSQGWNTELIVPGELLLVSKRISPRRTPRSQEAVRRNLIQRLSPSWNALAFLMAVAGTITPWASYLRVHAFPGFCSSVLPSLRLSGAYGLSRAKTGKKEFAEFAIKL